MDLVSLIVGLLFLGIGPALNWAIYNWAYQATPQSPWFRKRWKAILEAIPPSDEVDLQKYDLNPDWKSRIPIVGWFFLRHESSYFGRGHWIRPMVIELVLPVSMGFLFQFYRDGGLYPEGLRGNVAAISLYSLTWLFWCHAILFVLLWIATFIDLDEKTIPDVITIPGTLLALVLAVTVFPFQIPTTTHAYQMNRWGAGPKAAEGSIESMTAFHPWIALPKAGLPNAMGGKAGGAELRERMVGWFGLLIGWFAFSLWCFALADRRWIARRGFRKAIVYFFAVLARSPATKALGVLWGAGMLGISVAWCVAPSPNWISLLSSLVSIVLGGGLVWMVRIVAGAAMNQEALGFGDVTLMAMIAAYWGWQLTLMAFFLAPLLAIPIVLVVYLTLGERQIPFGPYLCLASVLVLVGWSRLWNSYFYELLATQGFELGILFVGGICLIGGLLYGWRLLKSVFSVASGS